MSEIFYAGGTTTKDISSNDLINDWRLKVPMLFLCENRNDLVSSIRSHLTDNCVLLLMGARDPSLEQFAKQVWSEL
jgi:UDP-N-acetylmuramate--alanine ligase